MPLTTHAQQTVSPSESTGWSAAITETPVTGAMGISFLSWKDRTAWVDTEQDLQYTILKGHVSRTVNQLMLNGKNVYVNDAGDFEIRFGFRGSEKLFRITVLDQDNQVSRAQFKLAPPDQPPPPVAQAYEPETLNYAMKRSLYSIGAGYTRIHYEQTGIDAFDEHVLIIKGAVTYRVVPNRFDLGLSGFVNALVIKSTSEEYKIHYLGLNLRAGYHLLPVPSRLRIVLNAGVFYNTSFGTVGFAHMYGPQFYPEFSYGLGNGRSLMTYVKLSPAIAKSQSIDFSKNREIAFGLHYLFTLKSKRRMSVGIDYSKLDLVVGTDTASTSTLSLAASILF